MRKIQILDSTLREGEQREGITFSLLDKVRIVKELDRLGVDYIEVPSPLFGHSPELFEELKKLSLSAEIVAFGRTCKAGCRPEEDPAVLDLLSAGTKTVTVFGKAWKKQVETVLRTDPGENIRMITDTVSYLKAQGRTVFFDAEHFFDGCEEDESYALGLLSSVEKAGADLLCLCDTRGGFFPDAIVRRLEQVKKLTSLPVAIHVHNDSGFADAATCEAVLAGADQIQGTVNGIGERCGNANLATCIANLQLKKGFSLLPDDRLPLLTGVARSVAQICNISTSSLPYVSRRAFAHKAGTHIDGVIKDPTSFEHIDPSAVGNQRDLLVSGLSGRSAILPLLRDFIPGEQKDSPETDRLLEVIKTHESAGYTYESAHASLELLVRKTLGIHQSHFRVERFKLFNEQTAQSESNAPILSDSVLPTGLSSAFVKIAVGDRTEMTAAEGDGPVNALDSAIRKALNVFFPHLAGVQLVDYKVRIIDGSTATGAVVRVLIDTSDGVDTYTTVGVSADIIEASKQAIIDSLEYALYKADNRT